ncbi:MAG: bifunctional diaminohydroxyphosphoribosylaminopyrimidine deaminase/5-amino-6-(5-phosphoribosylamino)uracil reductase RibD [Helicobacteraceae bacterium]|jgi:diaminohydroxyphosphoribosylaminopyrimidine deaminase/5-amino-6-(5-phosphoribosylamino)uracil reductase|nr:bifunctional diaminohydroxyphosphoribosylaminopyrimidine deaminase/5-amino-6-(5-phosphoribosylamino)uracil reductase RibD [Helicobacteraceae bacterium]
MLDEFYMRLALSAAWKYQLLTYPNPSVGAAALDRQGRLIAVSAHKAAGAPHAEINALYDAFCELCPDKAETAKLRGLQSSDEIHNFLRERHGGLFEGATLFITLEPCAKEGKTPACAPLIADLGVQRVVIGRDDPNSEMAGGGKYLSDRGVAVTRGVCIKECAALSEPFNVWLRRAFVLFKWAQRLNATIDEGRISGDLALDETHSLRALCDLLVVGGATVRADRPILDARRVNAKAPNAQIISAKTNFDRTIPLFNVADRRVVIAPRLNLDRGFILIEGGANLLNYLADQIDWVLCYETLALSGGKRAIGFDRRLELLRGDTIGENLKIWAKVAR